MVQFLSDRQGAPPWLSVHYINIKWKRPSLLLLSNLDAAQELQAQTKLDLFYWKTKIYVKTFSANYLYLSPYTF